MPPVPILDSPLSPSDNNNSNGVGDTKLNNPTPPLSVTKDQLPSPPAQPLPTLAPTLPAKVNSKHTNNIKKGRVYPKINNGSDIIGVTSKVSYQEEAGVDKGEGVGGVRSSDITTSVNQPEGGSVNSNTSGNFQLSESHQISNSDEKNNLCVPMLDTPLTYAEDNFISKSLPTINVPRDIIINPRSPHNLVPSPYFRSTLHTIPNSKKVQRQCQVPIGVVITPFKDRKVARGGTLEEEDVPIISDVIARCVSCKAYICPYSTLYQTSWRCAVCDCHNKLPPAYTFKTATSKGNIFDRPELNYSMVNYLASSVDDIRPRILLFVIDITEHAIETGMVKAVTETILKSLDRIPNPNSNLKVGFITVDSTLQFYKLSESSADFEMIIDNILINDDYEPPHPDLMFDLKLARLSIENLLKKIPKLIMASQKKESGLGYALKVANNMLKEKGGGQVLVFQSILPTIKSGDLSVRENAALLGTVKESSLLQPATNFYKELALMSIDNLVSFDMFLFGSRKYLDIATLGSLPKLTGGTIFYYPDFDSSDLSDLTKLEFEVSEFLSKEYAKEVAAVLRTPSTLRANVYYGNQYLYASQSIVLPYVAPHWCYTVELYLDSSIWRKTVGIQSAFAYTDNKGVKYVRVMTMVLPVTSNLGNIFQSIDQTALVTFLTKKAVDNAINNTLDQVYTDLINQCKTIIQTSQKELSTSFQYTATHSSILNNIKSLPFLTLAIIKNLVLKRGNTLSSDLRSSIIHFINMTSPELLYHYLVPKFYPLHQLTPDMGTIVSNKLNLPPRFSLTGTNIYPDGMYLLVTGYHMMIMVGSQVHPDLLYDLFAIYSYAELQPGKTVLPLLDTLLSRQVNAIIHHLATTTESIYHPTLYIVKDTPISSELRQLFSNYLLEDSSATQVSYKEFIKSLSTTTK